MSDIFNTSPLPYSRGRLFRQLSPARNVIARLPFSAVIASEAKQSMAATTKEAGLLRRCAPRNDGFSDLPPAP
jgi:hypothetical protein